MMKRMNGASAWMMAAMLSLGVAACGDASDRNDEIDNAGDQIEDAGRDAGEATRDAGSEIGDAVGTAGRATGAALETADVKTALMTDSRVEADDINVDTNHDTKTVVLKGMVPSEAQKDIAEEIARREAEGYRVDNQLRIGRN
ncbi:MAG: BON domain-containing protein [Vicinamibacterales bacterium]